MKKQYTKKQIQEAIKYWQKQLNESYDYPLFVQSLDQLAENDLINEGDPTNVDYIALENQSPLGKIAFGLLQQFIIKHGNNQISSAQFASCKSMKKLLSSLKLEFKDDIDRWMEDKVVTNRQPMAVLKNNLKDALNNKSTCFLIMAINPNIDRLSDDYDSQAVAKILNNLCGSIGIWNKDIPSGLILSNGSQYVIAAF